MWPFRKKAVAAPEAPEPEMTFDPFLGDADARRLSRLLGDRDWAAARTIIDDPDPARHSFYVGIASTKSGLMEWIDDAVRTDPEPTLPLLVKGLKAIGWAWEARGGGYADSVSDDAWKVFAQRLVVAENCLDDVLDRDPKNVEALVGMITLANARSKGLDEIQRAFAAVIAVDPTHQDAHWSMLQAVCRKWHGSSELMFEFARERAAAHPGTGLPVLIAYAHLEEWLSRKRDYAYLEQPEVGADLKAAAEQSIWHPAFREGLETPRLWNAFAMAFAMGDNYAEAERCFARIGDGLATRKPWAYYGKPGKAFLKWRDWTRHKLEEGA
ncbi:hypothetical protein AB0B66_00875 [Catellatospora sp. NPDC049111]|uniref:hypothetical protein n=1 Tax=Catellatospora sp. NPDC049111 TaxID=3155271 RepID=UPI00340C51BC